MKAIVKSKPEPGLQLCEAPEPEPGPDEVLIRVKAVGICGTDVHIFKWDEWSANRIKPPLLVGHEFVGVVEEVGREVRHIRKGARVSAEGHITCGHCRFCRTGQGHICREVEIIGVDRDGCFAEYLAMPADNIWPVPDSIPDKYASVFDPLGNAMHTVMSQPVAGRTVLITGAGAIGLFAVAIARAAGAGNVVAVEPNRFKRRLALEAGADVVLDPADEELAARVLDASEGLGPEVFLEMSGNADALVLGLRLLRNGGHAALLGIPPREVTLNLPELVIFKAATIRGVNGRRMYDTWYQCQSFLERHRLSIDTVITHTFPFAEYAKAFDVILGGNAGKLVMFVDGA
ncbi:MAG: L-threonine 3-dehydrogenase [Kiritimatiellae bacterium]|nr:L-threonine 3-dehydrogenase [Kiritimatiellia bacterium]